MNDRLGRVQEYAIQTWYGLDLVLLLNWMGGAGTFYLLTLERQIWSKGALVLNLGNWELGNLGSSWRRKELEFSKGGFFM